MNKKIFLITYEAYDINGIVIKKGQFKVKNQDCELGAKINFEKYLIRTLSNFNKLYISECREQFGGPLGDLFNDIFGGVTDINDIFKGFKK